VKPLQTLMSQELSEPRRVDPPPKRPPSVTGAGTVLVGAAMAIANYVIYSIAMVLLARHVSSIHTFGDFSAAVAAVTVGATAGTLGLEKFLLKFIPASRVRGELDLIRGFRRFAPIAVFLVSLAVGGVLFLIYLLSEPASALHHPSFLAGIAVLPIVVLGCYYLEVTTTDGAYLWGTVIYRVLFPGLVLVGVFVIDRIQSPIVAVQAVLMWGACWAVILVLLVIVARASVPPDECRGRCCFERLEWMRHSCAFLTYSLLLSLMANTGVLVLGFVTADKQQTGVYAAIAQLGAVFIVISTAMNRWYGPQIATLIASADVDRGQRVIRSRRLIMWSLAVVYALFLIFLGKPVLGLFGPEYQVGHTALLIIGLGALVSGVNSITPIYIQYSGREWFVPLMLSGGFALAVGLTIPGALYWGIEGAATGYAISTILLFICFNLKARQLRRELLRGLGRTDLAPLI
jgi:O-antigen/teichoic acid export membrane protein